MKERNNSNVTFVIVVFGLNSYFNKHIATVHEEKKPFKCDNELNICGLRQCTLIFN